MQIPDRVALQRCCTVRRVGKGLEASGDHSESLWVFFFPMIPNDSRPFQNRMAGTSRHLCVPVRFRRQENGAGCRGSPCGRTQMPHLPHDSS